MFPNARDKMVHLIEFLALPLIRRKNGAKLAFKITSLNLIIYLNDLRLYVTGSFNRTISVLDVAIL